MNVPVDELVEEMAARYESASFQELTDLYFSAHDLPARLLARGRDYFLRAVEREAWTVTYIEFSLTRYADRRLAGAQALDAGCGSGGALPHLTRRFARVAGIDPDLPALLVAAKRAEQLGIASRVALVAGMLEQPVFATEAFELIKCTDVIEHVEDPVLAARAMAAALGDGGLAFVLTPNKWSLFNPEPHVRMWGVQFLPARWADAWVERTVGVPYSEVATLLSYRGLMKALRLAGMERMRFIPIEDKHLNPKSARGRRLKQLIDRRPGRWFSAAARPIQPTLEVLCGTTEAGLSATGAR